MGTEGMEELRDLFAARTGCDAQEAENVLATIVAGWPSIADGKLPRLVTLLANNTGFEPTQIVLWLFVTLGLERDPIGRELVFGAGCQTAIRWGVSPQLAKLVEQCAMASTTEQPRKPRGH